MMENSKIEWTHHTFNPWIGCTKVSAGCKNCYAETLMDKRYHKVSWGPGRQRQRTSEANWRKPLQWNDQAEIDGQRYRVFCASLADVFDEEVPQTWRDDLWVLIDKTIYLDWLLLTKRPENIENMIPDRWSIWFENGHIPPNIWLGVSAENQEQLESRWNVLESFTHYNQPIVQFLSLEPLLDPIDLSICLEEIDLGDEEHTWWTRPVDWVIIGGESGPGARPMDVKWATNVVTQCNAANVPVFMKQLGSNPSYNPSVGSWGKYPVNGKGNNMDKWPSHLRIREFPE